MKSEGGRGPPVQICLAMNRHSLVSIVVQRMSAKISNPPASPGISLMACKTARQRTPLSADRMGYRGQWRAGGRQLRKSIEKVRAQVYMGQG